MRHLPILVCLLPLVTAAVDLPALPLTVESLASPPAGAAVLIAQPLGRKGPTSIRHFPPASRELSTSPNPSDPKGGRFFKRDRDLGQTFTVPGEVPVRLRRVCLRVGPVSDGSCAGAAGAKVSMQFFTVTGEAVLHDNGTNAPGLTVSKGYPGNPLADDYLTGETYTHLAVARGGALPQELRTGGGNTGQPTAESDGTVLGFTVADGPVLQPGQRYAFLVMLDEPDAARALPLDNWDFINIRRATPEQLRSGPYAGGHAIRREGSMHTPWQDPLAFDQGEAGRAAAAFPAEFASRLAVPPGTWGRPDVDTWRDLVFWIEGEPIAP